jgi:hypothetical protein
VEFLGSGADWLANGAIAGTRVDGGIANGRDRIREVLPAILCEDLTIMLPYGFAGASVNPEVLGP